MPYKCIPDNGVEDQIHLYFAVNVLMFITKKKRVIENAFSIKFIFN